MGWQSTWLRPSSMASLFLLQHQAIWIVRTTI
jgi:hypothetical protein